MVSIAFFALWLSTAHGGAGPAWQVLDQDVARFNQGVEAVNNGQLGVARKAFEAVLKHDPKCGPALLSLAEVHLRSNDAAQAIEYLKPLTERFGDRADVHDYYSRALFAAQDFATARKEAELAVALAKDQYGAHSTLFMALQRIGDRPAIDAEIAAIAAQFGEGTADCLRLFDQAESKDTAVLEPLHRRCQKEGIPEAASQVVPLAQSLGFQTGEADLGGDALHGAIEALNSGRFAEARKIAEATLRETPWRTDAMAVAGSAAINLGDVPGALGYARQLVKADTWVDVVESGSASGVLTKGAADHLQLTQQEIIAFAAISAFQAGLSAEGLPVVIEARKRWPDNVEISAAAVFLAAPAAPETAKHLAALLDKSPNNKVVGELASLSAFERPDAWSDDRLIALGSAEEPASRSNVYGGLQNSKAHARCLDIAAAISAHSSAEIGAEWRTRAYECAIYAPNLAAADALHKEGIDATAAMTIEHAGLLLEADRASEGRDLLVAVEPRLRPEDQARWLETRLTIAVMLNEVDEARRLVVGKTLTPNAKLNYGIVLANSGDSCGASAVLDGACAAMQGEAKASCSEVVKGILAACQK